MKRFFLRVLADQPSVGTLRSPCSRGFSSLAALAAGAAVVAASTFSSGDAQAAGPVTPTYKGTVGGALLGGEIIIIPMGAAGVNRGWPYFVFGGLGMVGGAIGGYFMDTKLSNSGGPAEPSLYMLAGGLALVIPAVVLAMNGTAYRPPDGDRNDPANNRPAREPPAPPPGAPPAGGVGSPATDRPAAPGPGAHYQYRSHYRSATAGLPHIPTSLLDMYTGKLGFGVPGPQVRPLYTQAEMARFGVTQGAEVQLPVFKAAF